MSKISLEQLNEVGWLAEQPAEFREWAASVGRWKWFRAGRVVYQAGDESDGAYGLAEGGLQISFPLVAEEPVTVYRAEVGFWIGDAAELSSEYRLVTVAAATDTRLLHLPSSSIRTLLAQQPEQWRCFYRLSMKNFRLTVSQLAEALSLTVRARTCRRLLSISWPSGDATITQDELAQLLGVTRPTIRRCLQDLENLGAIETHYRKLRVTNRSVLEAFKDEQ